MSSYVDTMRNNKKVKSNTSSNAIKQVSIMASSLEKARIKISDLKEQLQWSESERRKISKSALYKQVATLQEKMKALELRHNGMIQNYHGQLKQLSNKVASDTCIICKKDVDNIAKHYADHIQELKSNPIISKMFEIQQAKKLLNGE